MSRSHPAPSVGAPTPEAAVAALRARGLRISAARRLVLEALYAAGRPLTAEQIADGVGGVLPPSDLASVYRNLELLQDVGLVRHVHLGHGAGLYAVAATGERGYVACERCDALTEVVPPALDAVRAAVRAASGYDASLVHFPIIGVCPACADPDANA